MKKPPQFLLALFLITAIAHAQALPEGYASNVHALPANAGNVLSLPGALTAWFDGSDLVLNGQGPQRSLLHFATPVFGSFTIAAGPGLLLFAESSTHGLWLVPLNGQPPTQPIANLAFNYDAVMYAPGRAIVSAKTSGFSGPDNDLFALDLQTGAAQLLAQLPGASGPVTLDQHGHVYYATSSPLFPTPPGQTTILRFRRNVVDQALTSHQVLGLAQAETVLAGLDSASDLAFDDDGDLLFVDWFQSTIGEIDGADGHSPSRKVLVDYAATTFSGSNLQFFGSTNSVVFEPFQPLGSRLLVHESTFGTVSQLRSITPRAASLTSTVVTPVPSGAFALAIDHGPAHGSGLIAIALPGAQPLLVVAVAGFEQPLLWNGDLMSPVNSHFVTFDATGHASLPLHNPGFVPILGIVCQGAFLEPVAGVVGATAPLALLLTH